MKKSKNIQKSKILLPINPEFSNKIFSKEKKYEYRTKLPKSNVESILVYETAPTKKVIGEIKINKILKDKPNNIWNKTKDFAGIDKKRFDNYFKNHKLAMAYCIGKVEKFNKPKELSEFGINYVPQSFIYLNNEKI